MGLERSRPNVDTAVVQMVRDAQEHHPAWRTIVSIRADLTAAADVPPADQRRSMSGPASGER
jgi:hypothetical protein